MKKYKITYKQKFMGEVIQESYIRSVNDDQELHEAINALYEDPHVQSVDYEELKAHIYGI